jgi:hypothetical protein
MDSSNNSGFTHIVLYAIDGFDIISDSNLRSKLYPSGSYSPDILNLHLDGDEYVELRKRYCAAIISFGSIEVDDTENPAKESARVKFSDGMNIILDLTGTFIPKCSINCLDGIGEVDAMNHYKSDYIKCNNYYRIQNDQDTSTKFISKISADYMLRFNLSNNDPDKSMTIGKSGVIKY